MKKILIRKILKYDPTFGGEYSRYEGYRQITLKQLNPSIQKEQSLPHKLTVDTMFYSGLKRGYESSELIGDSLYSRETRLLNEITFDLSALVDLKEFETYGSELVRTRFVNSFIADSLNESRKEIFERIDKLKVLIQNHEQVPILLVSHSFFMKVLEADIKTNSAIRSKPQLLTKFIESGEKTYNFGSGFEFQL